MTSVPHPWQGSGARRGKVRGSGGPVPTACAPPTARQLELRTMAQSLPAPAGLAAGLELATAHAGLTAGPGLAGGLVRRHQLSSHGRRCTPLLVLCAACHRPGPRSMEGNGMGEMQYG